jgi:cysteine desulfuration protein SufE
MNQSSILEVQDRIVREFNLFPDWTDKYEHIISIGKKLSPIDPIHKVDSNKVHGCQSQVWLHAQYIDGKVHYQADSDALIVKGIIALLLRLYNDRSPDEIIETNPDFISKIGLDKHISQNRANGLLAMLKQIKLYAVVFISQYP